MYLSSWRCVSAIYAITARVPTEELMQNMCEKRYLNTTFICHSWQKVRSRRITRRWRPGEGNFTLAFNHFTPRAKQHHGLERSILTTKLSSVFVLSCLFPIMSSFDNHMHLPLLFRSRPTIHPGYLIAPFDGCIMPRGIDKNLKVVMHYMIGYPCEGPGNLEVSWIREFHHLE